jgi:hypothetical protein
LIPLFDSEELSDNIESRKLILYKVLQTFYFLDIVLEIKSFSFNEQTFLSEDPQLLIDNTQTFNYENSLLVNINKLFAILEFPPEELFNIEVDLFPSNKAANILQEFLKDNFPASLNIEYQLVDDFTPKMKILELPDNFRESLKLMFNFAIDHLMDMNIRYLFLAIEIYYRVIGYYMDNSIEEQRLICFSCLYLAGQFDDLFIIEYLPTIIPKWNSEYDLDKVQERQEEIINYLKGVLNINLYYNRCICLKDLKQLYKFIMDKNSKVYLQDWYPEKRDSSYTVDDGYRNTMVREFF